jgi:long-subunit acyl-CoA synthetase (AMP-forming)
VLSNAILDALGEHAVRRGSSTALSAGDQCLSYAELAAAVESLASWIREEGYRAIALDADNGLPWAIADLAAMRAGVMLIPIPGFFTQAQVDHVVSVARSDLMLADRAHRDRWCVAGCEVSGIPVPLSAFRLPSSAHEGAEAITRGGGKITFTSGSTGRPKGVVLSNASLAATSAAIVSALAPLRPRKHLSVLPLSTLLENIAGLYAPLMHGSEVCLPDARETGLTGASLDIERFAGLLGDSDADTMILVPQLLTAVITLAELGMLTLPTFKLLAVGGGRVARQLLERAAALRLPVCEGYGLSECASVLTLNLPGAQRPGSVGRPLAHARIRTDERGEILVRAPRMLGYLDEGAGSDDWYATGDLGHFDEDGYLYISGRRRNVFITSYGRNVNPEWPEAALTQRAAIAQALVFGEAREHNLALLWLRFEQSDEELDALVAAANAELPDYAQVHRWIVLDGVPDDELQTSNGRLRRAAVLECYRDRIDAHYREHDANPLAENKLTTTRRRHAVL